MTQLGTFSELMQSLCAASLQSTLPTLCKQGWMNIAMVRTVHWDKLHLALAEDEIPTTIIASMFVWHQGVPSSTRPPTLPVLGYTQIAAVDTVNSVSASAPGPTKRCDFPLIRHDDRKKRSKLANCKAAWKRANSNAQRSTTLSCMPRGCMSKWPNTARGRRLSMRLRQMVVMRPWRNYGNRLTIFPRRMNWCIRNGGCGGCRDAAVVETQPAAALRRVGGTVFKDDTADAIEDLDGIEVALIIAVA